MPLYLSIHKHGVIPHLFTNKKSEGFFINMWSALAFRFPTYFVRFIAKNYIVEIIVSGIVIYIFSNSSSQINKNKVDFACDF